MKNFLVILTIGFLGLSATAGISEWHLTGEEHFAANDNESFLSLQAQFPQHFADVDGTSVSSATLDLYNYTFTGPTMCAPTDPRLNVQTVAKSLCFSANQNCMAIGQPAPNGDPCM